MDLNTSWQKKATKPLQSGQWEEYKGCLVFQLLAVRSLYKTGTSLAWEFQLRTSFKAG